MTPDEVITGNRILLAAKSLGISCCKTDYIDEIPISGRVIVTHNGGYNIKPGPHGTLAITSPQNMHNNAMAMFASLPDGVTWYAQNADAEHDFLRGLPLGVTNISIPSGHEDDRDFTLPPDGNTAGRLVCDRLNQRLPTKNRVHLRLRLDTAPYERGYCLQSLQGLPFVTNDTETLPPEAFLDRLMSHEFVACPEGNGIDCHRVWEALYLGCYPICRPSIAMLRFKSLPILFVDDWQDVSEWLLDRHLSDVEAGKFSLDMLHYSYWREELCRASAP